VVVLPLSKSFKCNRRGQGKKREEKTAENQTGKAIQPKMAQCGKLFDFGRFWSVKNGKNEP
jgi:hypothetical protein